MLCDEYNHWKYEIKTKKKNIDTEVSRELELWKENKGKYVKNWKSDKQLKYILNSFLEISKNFPKDNIEISYDSKKLPYLDFFGTMLFLEKEKYFELNNLKVCMDLEKLEITEEAFWAKVVLLPKFFDLFKKDKLETFSLEGRTVIYKDQSFTCSRGGKLSFIKELSQIEPFEKILKESVELEVFGDKGQGNKLKNLVGKINMDFKKEFGIETAFSIEDVFVRRNF